MTSVILDLSQATYLSFEDEDVVRKFMNVYDYCLYNDDDEQCLAEAMEEVQHNYPHLWPIIDRLVLKVTVLQLGWDNPKSDPAQDMKDMLQRGFDKGVQP